MTDATHTAARPAVVLFACDPRIEAARKPLLGGRSAGVHAALLADTAERLRGGFWDLIFAWRGEEVRARSLRPTAVVHQRGRSFGERLHLAAVDVASMGYQRLVLVGADCPSLATAEVREALSRLERGDVDVVIGPATDGGVNLLALDRGTLDRLELESLPWGTAELCGALLEEVARLGLRAEQLAVSDDVDTVEVLARVLAAAPDSRLARLIARLTPPGLGFADYVRESSRTPLVLFGPSFLKSPPDKPL